MKSEMAIKNAGFTDAPIKCPKCKEALPPEAVIRHRSFVCPHCRRVLNHESAHNERGTIGCLATIVVGAVTLVLLGVHWLIGFVVAVIAGFIAANFTVSVADRFWPRPAVLTVCEYGQADPLLAAFLEEIAQAGDWTKALDDRLSAWKDSVEYDCALDGDALDAAMDYRDLLKGALQKPRSSGATNLEDLRQELRSIARDIRFASKT